MNLEREDEGGVFVTDYIALAEKEKPPPLRPPPEERRRRNYDGGTRLCNGWRRRRPT